MIGPEQKAWRNYGSRERPVAEDPTRCVAKVTSESGWLSRQCSRPRGKGVGGQFCGTHARTAYLPRCPEPGSYLRDLLATTENHHHAARKQFEAAREHMEKLGREVFRIREIIGEVPDGD